MPRPKSKSELLQQSQANYRRLIDFVESFSEVERNKEFPKNYLNRNINDVLAHLHHWHLMFLEWHKKGMAGKKPDIPAKGYTWKTLPDLNRKIQEQYSHWAYQDIKEQLDDSFGEVSNLIQKYTDQELFEKKKYPWTGTTSLGSYLISTTSSHYDWAYKLIKKCMKAR
ncbi:MAG: ClbS/DfsB family four-helix bundle protein [Pricia sp.]|nr:ClbS/DfsB family four-helix bundle protein [Pricia sp.]